MIRPLLYGEIVAPISLEAITPLDGLELGLVFALKQSKEETDG